MREVVLVGKKVNHSRVESIHLKIANGWRRKDRIHLFSSSHDDHRPCQSRWSKMIDLRGLAKCRQQERSTEMQSLMLMSLAGLITSGFLIDEFIETT